MKKRLLSILVMCVMVLSLAACGNTKTESNSDTEKDTMKNETKDETKDETSGETVTLELLLHKSEAVDMMTEVVKQFTEKYPNIVVDVVSPADYSTVIQSRFTANDYPDIWTWANESAWFPYFTGGYCYDLSGESWMSSLSDANKDWVTFEVEGNEEVVALPYWLNTYGIFYNVDLFEEKGYEIPTTLDELWALCDQMVADDVVPFSVSDGDAWTTHNIYERLAGLFFQDKGEKFQAIADGELSATEDDELRMLAETLVKIREYGTGDSLALVYGCMYDAR